METHDPPTSAAAPPALRPPCRRHPHSAPADPDSGSTARATDATRVWPAAVDDELDAEQRSPLGRSGA